MCFTQSISLIFALSGSATCLFFYSIKKPFHYYIHTLFYTGMEFLQFFQYFYINQCNNSVNIYLTDIAYILIWLQPLLFNYFYYKITLRNMNIFIYNMYLSGIIFLLSMDRLFTNFIHKMSIEDNYINNYITAGKSTCTYQGNKHLYWIFDIKTNYGVEVNYLWYVLLICFPALWLHDIKKGLFISMTFMSGLSVSYFYTKSLNESIPFWCILSVPYLMTSYIL